MRAVGITSGIGSLLIGARQAGFSVEGNLEWREYYHQPDAMGRTTFGENFPGALMAQSIDGLETAQIERLMNADIALGHPECGRFSRLSGSVRNREVRAQDPGDIPLFVELVARLRPRFFVMDDLPKSLVAYPMAKYAEALPDYDLFPEWVSNWGYGNVQKGRDRMFMLGALKSERWTFVPAEHPNPLTVADVIGDLPEPRRGANVPNQDPHDDALDCFRALNLNGYRKKNTWAQVREYFADKRGGFTLEYPTADGRIVKRIGFLKGHWDGPSHVLTGGNAILHNLRCQPYTIRERARIQGFPDDFVFYGTPLNDRGEWNHDMSMPMVKQTGKAMPVQFGHYVSTTIARHIRGEPVEHPPLRVLAPNPDIDQAKRWYCETVGYADQSAACGACWMATRCEIRVRRYGYAPLAVAGATRAPTSSPKKEGPKRVAPGGVPRVAERTSVSPPHRPLDRDQVAAPRRQTTRRPRADIVREPVQTESMSFTGSKKK